MLRKEMLPRRTTDYEFISVTGDFHWLTEIEE